jgi:acyl-coenzyme A synthetase/AMP-(fatty) acid ligase
LCVADWFDTGDLAEQDTAGYFRILGRHVDQININGYKINPSSIEKQLLQNFPNLQDCVIFGKDKLKCLYVGDYSPHHIQKFLVDVNAHCFPRVLQQVDSVPLTSTGKVSRTWLDQNY